MGQNKSSYKLVNAGKNLISDMMGPSKKSLMDDTNYKIYVSVRAEGPTRIIRFTDCKDDKSKATSKEEIYEMLSNKAETLQNSLSEIDKLVTLKFNIK